MIVLFFCNYKFSFLLYHVFWGFLLHKMIPVHPNFMFLVQAEMCVLRKELYVNYMPAGTEKNVFTEKNKNDGHDSQNMTEVISFSESRKNFVFWKRVCLRKSTLMQKSDKTFVSKTPARSCWIPFLKKEFAVCMGGEII